MNGFCKLGDQVLKNGRFFFTESDFLPETTDKSSASKGLFRQDWLYTIRPMTFSKRTDMEILIVFPSFRLFMKMVIWSFVSKMEKLTVIR